VSSGSTSYFNFNSNSAAMRLVATNNIPIGNSPYTISVFFQADNLNHNGALTAWGIVGNDRQNNLFRLDGGGGFIMEEWWGTALRTSGITATNTWFNAVSTWDGLSSGGTRTMVINNTIIGTDKPTGVYNAVIGPGVYIGRSNAVASFSLRGKIALIQIWNSCLTPNQISTNFNTYRSRYGL
jgi:hypothetical protein